MTVRIYVRASTKDQDAKRAMNRPGIVGDLTF
jgi:DNA invertase Pin-like site-specific DNA recombinase